MNGWEFTEMDENNLQKSTVYMLSSSVDFGDQ